MAVLNKNGDVEVLKDALDESSQEVIIIDNQGEHLGNLERPLV